MVKNDKEENVVDLLEKYSAEIWEEIPGFRVNSVNEAKKKSFY